LGFGASAWSLADRDRLIGWSSPQRQRNLHLVINNHRFRLLPWVHCPNLASRVLGLVCRRLAADWFSHYGYRPVLLETFVHQSTLPQKAIFLYPLRPDFKEILTR
jgi:Domain of unknown function (DUF4338)